MPVYPYKCSNGHHYEESRGFDEDQKVTQCLECGSELIRTWDVPSFTLVGKGFYSNGG
jgi:putative FmdB family regulatory protein